MPDLKAETVRDTYNNMAESYDQVDSEAFYINQYDLYWRHLETWKGKLDGVILDVGCGTGIQTLWLAKRSQKVFGIDISNKLLSIAHNKLTGFDNSIVLEADAIELPFEDHSFDAVVSYGETLSHIDNYHRAFEEICRVLRPDGFLAFSVLNKWNLALLYSPSELFNAFSVSCGHERIWRCADDSGILRATPLKTFTRCELIELGAKVGFEILEAEGIHIFSLVIPLRLQYANMGFWGRCFRRLGQLDKKLNRWPILSGIGYSTIYTARRK